MNHSKADSHFEEGKALLLVYSMIILLMNFIQLCVCTVATQTT